MTAIALGRQKGFRVLGALVTLTVLFFAILFATAWHANTRNVDPIPLKPCKRCTGGCPCPRLSGEIRCGCP